MKTDQIDNLKFVWPAINFILPMIWLAAITLWGFVWRML